MAELADAPGLGLRNHRFHSVTFRFKAKRFYERKTGNFRVIPQFTNSQQRSTDSSANPSTRNCQSSLLLVRF
ncbi:MAG: hypothetical protein DMF03_03115 [Verrucomicrobia bacterium]|nr:MAG: hypothetical protein DMF03_03115 [Verrucomicrobiota bacterium]